jgi:hypothetical protein
MYAETAVLTNPFLRPICFHLSPLPIDLFFLFLIYGSPNGTLWRVLVM